MNVLALGAIVLVEVVNPGPAPSSLAGALMDACTLALRQQSTCMADARSTTEQVVARAFVKWSESGHEAFIEVDPPPRRRAEDIRRRTLSFRSRDDATERWRAVGFAVANMVDEVRLIEAVPLRPPQDDAMRRAKASERDVVPEQRAMPLRRLRMDALGKASGDVNSRLSVGGQLRLTSQWGSSPWLASVDGEYRATGSSDGKLSIGWLAIGAGPGAGFRAAQGRLALEARLEGLAESLFANGTDPVSLARGSRGAWTFGVREGLSVAWMWTESWGMTLAFDASQVTEDVDILAHGAVVARVPRLRWSAGLGFRFAPF